MGVLILILRRLPGTVLYREVGSSSILLVLLRYEGNHITPQIQIRPFELNQ